MATSTPKAKIVKAKFPGSGSRVGFAVVFSNLPDVSQLPPERRIVEEYRWKTCYFNSRVAAIAHINERILTYMGV